MGGRKTSCMACQQQRFMLGSGTVVVCLPHHNQTLGSNTSRHHKKNYEAVPNENFDVLVSIHRRRFFIGHLWGLRPGTVRIPGTYLPTLAWP